MVERAGGRIVAVASGKGGVGKTWLSITLAHALARAGRRALLIDADLGLANVDTQLGLMPAADLGRVIDGRMRAAQAVFAGPGGFDILAGRSGSATLAALPSAALTSLIGELTDLAGRYDCVLIDLGAGIGTHVRRLACAADRLLVVATDEPTSLTDAYAVLKLHHQDRDDPRLEQAVAVNFAPSHAAGQRTYAALARACANFLGTTPRCAGIVRRDAHVRDAIRAQTLLLSRSPTCAAAADVEAMAEGLLGTATLPRAPAAL